MRHTDDPTLTRSFDLLWRGIELTTGAQREHRYEQLLAQAHDKGVDVEPIQYYLDFFRFGAPPTAASASGYAAADAAVQPGQRPRGHVPVPRAAPVPAVGRAHHRLLAACGWRAKCLLSIVSWPW